MAKNEVRGRLNREPNPPPGAQPGYNPQFYDLQGYAVDVDESNPYPSANYVQNDAGIWMPVSKDNPMPTQLTGSIEELYKNDSVEIESNSRINLKDITKMSKKQVTASIRAESSHDFLLDVDWRTSATGSSGYSIEAEKMIEAINELTAKSEEYITTKTNVARFRLANNSSETQRYLSVVVMGVD